MSYPFLLEFCIVYNKISTSMYSIILIRKVYFMLNKTIDYYNTNAKKFVEGTLNVDFKSTQDKFIAKLPKAGYILDFGCGSGRDTKYFLAKNFKVDAIDGSIELCKIASEYTNIKVCHMYFNELTIVNKYDGIWACSSILHLSLDDLVDVFKRMSKALKDKGIIYTSFKYGDFFGERNGRYFTDMTENSFAKLIANVETLEVEEQWITADVRPQRGNEKWLNLILRKK